MQKRWRYLLILAILFGCAERPSPDQTKLIAISWYYPNADYQRWVSGQDSSFRFIELYPQPYDKLDSILSTCDGLILSGGSDIEPVRYGVVDSLAQCGKVNPRRDSVEWAAVHIALKTGIPTLGVCRGMQMMNVALGGSLVLDLPDQGTNIIHQVEGSDAMHPVYAAPALVRITKTSSAVTNSNHHQAIDVLARELESLAWTEDSVIEGLRHRDTLQHPFFMGVQWHPERMDPNSPFATPLLEAFLNAANRP
jgi:putative glutamine amidotransferase